MAGYLYRDPGENRQPGIFGVIADTIATLERLPVRGADWESLRAERHLIVQALCSIATAVEHEHDQRKKMDVDRGPRVGG